MRPTPGAQRLPAPAPLPTLQRREDDAFASGLWHGFVIGAVVGLAAAVLVGWLR